MVGEGVPDVGKLNTIKGSLFIEMERTSLKGRKNRLVVELYSNGEKIEVIKTNFLGPVQ